MRWRFWLLEIPARVTEIGAAWYRLYWLVVLIIAALVAPVTVLTMLGAWLLGIRWGW